MTLTGWYAQPLLNVAHQSQLTGADTSKIRGAFHPRTNFEQEEKEVRDWIPLEWYLEFEDKISVALLSKEFVATHSS